VVDLWDAVVKVDCVRVALKSMCVCVCVCVRARARAPACAHACTLELLNLGT
jgi:hypothetical protein